MVIALFVLIGFGLLFMFASDDGGPGGGRSIEAVIRDQTKNLDGYERSVEVGKARLSSAPALAAAADSLRRAESEIASLKERATGLTAEIAAEKEALAAKSEEFADYKNRYRDFVRSKAEGSSMPMLVTSDGAKYEKVEIREVTAVGMQIRHSNGFKRIPFEVLPDDLKDYYQFDPDQKEDALALEAKAHSQHLAAVKVAGAQEDKANAEQRQRDQEEAKGKLRQDIAVKEAGLVSLASDITGLQNDLNREASEAASARAAGRMHVSKSNRINSRIRGKQNQMSALRSDIARMRSQL